tara:strand:- start:2747 stop:3859 length:1113 start_codon:yes stop_codon:yes gene_type:complete
MFRQYYCSRRWALPAYGLGGLIVSLWLIKAWADLRVNDWTGRFYNELQGAFAEHNSTDVTLDEDDSLDEGWRSLIVEWLFLSIPAVTIMPVVNWLTRIWAFQWRQAITADYIYRWRLLAKGAVELEGISQRVQDDAYQLAKGVDSFGQGVFNALLSLGTFVPLLWRLTSGMDTWPDGAIVGVNVGSNILGIGISSLVGRYLITLEYNNQAVEAAFRKELVYAEDGAAGYGTIEACRKLFSELRGNYYTLFLHLIYFELWSQTFDRATTLVPMLMLGHAVYEGELTLGSYMQIIGAYTTVQGGLSMLIHRWVEVNELLSVVRRLSELDTRLPPSDNDESDVLDQPAAQILVKETTPLVDDGTQRRRRLLFT